MPIEAAPQIALLGMMILSLTALALGLALTVWIAPDIPQ